MQGVSGSVGHISTGDVPTPEGVDVNTAEAAERTGYTVRQLLYAVKRGYVFPSWVNGRGEPTKKRGPGNRLRWNHRDLVMARTALVLRSDEKGRNEPLTRLAVEAIAANYGSVPWVAVALPDTIVPCETTDEVFDVITATRGVLTIIDLWSGLD